MLLFAPDVHSTVDFTKGYDFLEKELAALFSDGESGNRRVDKLARLFLKNGEEKWILVHVEVQGYREDEFAERMFQYFYRVYDKYRRKIFTIAIFSDENKVYRPDCYEYRYFDTELTYKYRSYKILDQDEKELQESENPFAMAVLAGLYVLKSKKDLDKRYEFKIRLIRLLLQKSWSRQKIEGLFMFIDAILQLPSWYEDRFEQEVNQLLGKGERTMGLTWDKTNLAIMYMEKGSHEELTKTVLIQIRKKLKLDILSEEVTKSVQNASVEQLENIRDNIFDIETLEDALKYLN